MKRMMMGFMAGLLAANSGVTSAEVAPTAAGLSSVARPDAGAPEGGGHNCCIDHAGPGCTDPDIEACVCGEDPLCCSIPWDDVCAGIVSESCGDECVDCLTPHLTPGCNDGIIQSCVCAQDSFCCNDHWDAQCVDEIVDFGCLSVIPVNDDCAAALQIVDDGSFLFRSTDATTDGPALPPECDDGNGVAFESDIWYCYTPECSNDITVSLCGPSDFDSRLAVYEGCACPVTDDRRVVGGCSDNSGKCPVAERPEITFEAEGGTSYLIRIGGGAIPADGEGTMQITGGSAGNRLDCNGNGEFDGCDILTNFSTDCNGNRYPDECETDSGEVLMHQLPTQINGEFTDADCDICDTGQQTRAERFVLDEPKQIVAIGLWGGYFSTDSAPADDFTVIFHATDVDGLPGTELATPGFVSSRFETGVQIEGMREWLFVLALDTPMNLDAGSYFVEIYNNTAGSPDSFFWETGDLDGDHGGAGSAFDTSAPGVDWVAQDDKNLAMVLFGTPAADCDGDQRPDACQATAACCMPDETCMQLIPECCVIAGGEAQDPGTDCATFGCDSPQIIHGQGLIDQTRPHSGYIDSRRESTDGIHFDQGLREALIRFDRSVFACDQSDVTAANFVLSETGGGTPPTVDGVAYEGGDQSYVRVHWDRPITIQQWTTLRADVCSVSGTPIITLGDLGPGTDEPDRVDFGFLPADVNQDSEVGPFDLIRFRQYTNDVSDPPVGVELDYIDVNRDGSLTPFDLIAFRQLVNGVPPSTRLWAGATIGPQP